MQRISVLLPVPDGPMIAVMPRAAIVEVDVLQYRLARHVGLRQMAQRQHRPSSTKKRHAARRRVRRRRAAAPSDALSPSSPCLRFGLGLFLRRFLVVGRLVEAAARARRHRAHRLPRRLVVDREEAVGAVERLHHFRREAVVVEARQHLVGELRIEVVRIRERRRREFLAAVDDAEVGFLDLAALAHAVEHVGGDGAGVVVARVHAHHRLVVLAGEDDLVVLVGRQAFLREERQRRQVAGVRRRRRVRDLLALEVGRASGTASSP